MNNGAGVTPAGGTDDAGGVENNINNELWQACAGPLVQLPAAGTHVVYFPQGHSEQVAASMRRDVDAQVPSYPNLPSKILCLLHSITLHADPETDEAYARMTLQPVPSFDKEAILRSDLSMKADKTPTEFFCKTLTASDTSTHGGFSVPRRAAEKIFPLLDRSVEPPSQELVARDLHDNTWKFRHLYRGKPKRHLLTTGWSLFIGTKRLVAGDSVLFVRDEKHQQLLLGIRRANRQPPNLSSSVLSSDSMHIGILAAAAHASANSSPFTVFYNPRANPSEFVIPLANYFKAVCSSQISTGMRFRMMFETEDSGTRRYMGTITGISDLDPVRWKGSQWRSLQVGWDESVPGHEKRGRVSIWEIEPVTAPFFICPAPSFFQTKRPRISGMPDVDGSDIDGAFGRTMQPWLSSELGSRDPRAQWMNMQPNYMNFGSADLPAGPVSEPLRPNQLQPLSPLGSMLQQQAQPRLSEPRHSSPLMTTNQDVSSQILQTQSCLQAQGKLLLQKSDLESNHNLSQNLSQQQKQILDASQGFSGSMLTGQIQVNNPHETKATMFASPPQQPNAGIFPEYSVNAGNFTTMNVGGFHSTVTDDVPSCSTSPSTNNCSSVVIPTVMNGKAHNGNFVRDLQHKAEVKPSMNVPGNPNRGSLLPQTCHNNTVAARVNYLHRSSSPTSINAPHSTMFQGNGLDSEVHGSLLLGANNNIIDNQLGIPTIMLDDPLLITKNMDTNFSAAEGGGGLLLQATYEIHDEAAQPEPSTSMASQSFGVPDMAGFNSIDSALNDGGFIGRGSRAPPPQIPRMRTFTKVYKRGAVGRSIDVTRYSGYEELKRDLARRFGIEGQLEEGRRIGWKLVYVDHEGDVLLVGDDPWDEFVSCVRCIKILSPQEVQQMSLDGDFGYAEPSS